MDAGDYERVLAVARRLASTDDVSDVLGEIIDAMREVLRAERASVFQYAPGADGGPGSFFATRAHGLSDDFCIGEGRGIIGAAAAERRVVNVRDVSADPRFDASVDRATGFTTRCVLAAPMIDEGGELVGVVQVLNKLGGEGGVMREFDAADVAVAEHLAAQAGVALKRAALITAARRRDVLEAEMAAARVIQRGAMPSSMPRIPGWEIAAAWEPASVTAGDVYDVIDRGDGRAVVLLADATGHGVGAAMSASRVQAMVRLGVGGGLSLAELSERLNQRLVEDLPTGHFVTAFLGEIDRSSGALRYVAAGQAPVLLVSPDGLTDRFDATAPPLGIGRWRDGGGCSGAVAEVCVPTGCACVAASDGVFEGIGRGFAEDWDRSVDAVAELVASRLGRLDGGGSLLDGLRGEESESADDRTIVVLKRTNAR